MTFKHKLKNNILYRILTFYIFYLIPFVYTDYCIALLFLRTVRNQHTINRRKMMMISGHSITRWPTIQTVVCYHFPGQPGFASTRHVMDSKKQKVSDSEGHSVLRLHLVIYPPAALASSAAVCRVKGYHPGRPACRVTHPASWLTTAASSPTIAQEDCT